MITTLHITGEELKVGDRILLVGNSHVEALSLGRKGKRLLVFTKEYGVVRSTCSSKFVVERGTSSLRRIAS